MRLITGEETVAMNSSTVQKKVIIFNPVFSKTPLGAVYVQLGSANPIVKNWHAIVSSISPTNMEINYWVTGDNVASWEIRWVVIGI